MKINPYIRAIRIAHSAAVQLHADCMHMRTSQTLPAVYIATNVLFCVKSLVNPGYIYLYQYAM